MDRGSRQQEETGETCVVLWVWVDVREVRGRLEAWAVWSRLHVCGVGRYSACFSGDTQ